jgi:hypothetical protein
MQILADTETFNLLAESKEFNCQQGDPHCLKNYGEKCEKGCFEIRVDLQTMTVIHDES